MDNDLEIGGDGARSDHDSPPPGAQSTSEKAARHWQLQRGEYRQWVTDHFDWTWFACTQSTGSVAVMLTDCPKRFDALNTIGVTISIFNIVLFLMFNGLQITRWATKPSSFRSSFITEPECYMYGAWWLSIATILQCAQQYGGSYCGPWLTVALRVCFWIYATCTFLTTTAQFIVMSTRMPDLELGGNAGVLLTVLHAMLTGVVASVISRAQPAPHRLPMLVAGIGFLGYGWTVCMLYMSSIVRYKLEKGWPPVSSRPRLFMLVATGGYSTVILIGCARAIPASYGYFAAHPLAPEVLKILATWTSVFLWVFTFWAFSIALIITASEMFIRKNHQGRPKTNMQYNDMWWAAIFGNVGFTIATIYLGQEFESEAVLWVATGMVILVMGVWVLNLALMAKTIVVSLFFDPELKLS